MAARILDFLPVAHHIITGANMVNGWTANQYRLYRALLGTYLFMHFAQLLPWAGDVFSTAGMLPDAMQSPLFGIIPNVLALVDTPQFLIGLVAAGAVASIGFACGYRDKLAAVFLWYVLVCLFGRNPLIANPALPYVGWMLLAHLFVPRLARGPLPEMATSSSSRNWEMPRPLFAAAWIVLALAYSYSGYTKLLSPSWVSGDAISYVLQNPLARDYFLRDWVLALPDGALPILTWSVMGIELVFAPLALFHRMRPTLWSAMFAVQIGFLCLLNFADLTTPMLLFHLLTFDPAWIRAREPHSEELIFYDGTCGLCHRVVRFVLAEDRVGKFAFSPLQGETFKQTVNEKIRKELPDSFVVVDQSGRLLLRSDAVIHISTRLGGLWKVLGTLLAVAPRWVRDGGYALVGAIRDRLFANPDGYCPTVPPELRVRFIR
jgi:predicted DCC family thiol-disulfide oxidoreductase YuxK